MRNEFEEQFKESDRKQGHVTTIAFALLIGAATLNYCIPNRIDRGCITLCAMDGRFYSHYKYRKFLEYECICGSRVPRHDLIQP